MSRCIICDHCSDIDGGNRKYTWDDKENGHVCSRCRSSITEDLWFATEVANDLDEAEGWFNYIDADFDQAESSKLGRPSVLVELGLAVDAGKTKR